MKGVIAIASGTAIGFRTAMDLSSREPAQLRRTIEELETRIEEQDSLIERQLACIIEIEQRLSAKERQIDSRSDNFKLFVKTDDLLKDNRQLEDSLERLTEGFDSLFHVQLDCLEDSLIVLRKLPATYETKSLFTRIKKQSLAVERARDKGGASSISSLRQLADLEMEVIHFIISRPLLTFTRSEHYRAEVLLEALYRDFRLKSLSTPESQKILAEREEKPIDAKQALRAMRRAANLHPDKVRFDLKRKARLCKIDVMEAVRR